MTVSVKKAHKNIFSPNYNKINVVMYVLSIVLLSILIELVSGSLLGLVSLVAFVLLALYVSAIYPIAINNAINKRKGVFPNMFTDFVKIIKTSFVYTFGMFLVLIAALVPLAFAMIVFYKLQNPIVALLFIIPVLIVVKYSSQMFYSYVLTLDFKDWFNFEKAKELKKNFGKNLAKYEMRMFFFVLVSFILTVFFGVFFPIRNIFVFLIFIAILTPYIVDITAQLIRDAVEKKEEQSVQN